MTAYPFYRRENRGSEQKGDLPKAPQPACGRAGSQHSLHIAGCLPLAGASGCQARHCRGVTSANGTFTRPQNRAPGPEVGGGGVDRQSQQEHPKEALPVGIRRLWG